MYQGQGAQKDQNSHPLKYNQTARQVVPIYIPALKRSSKTCNSNIYFALKTLTAGSVKLRFKTQSVAMHVKPTIF